MVEKISIVIRRVALDKNNFFDRKITSNNWRKITNRFSVDVVAGERKKKKKKKQKIEVSHPHSRRTVNNNFKKLLLLLLHY